MYLRNKTKGDSTAKSLLLTTVPVPIYFRHSHFACVGKSELNLSIHFLFLFFFFKKQVRKSDLLGLLTLSHQL